MVQTLVEEAELQLLLELVDQCGEQEERAAFTDIRLALLQYFTSMEQYALGLKHPLSRTIHLLIQGLTWADALREIVCLLFKQARVSNFKQQRFQSHFNSISVMVTPT